MTPLEWIGLAAGVIGTEAILIGYVIFRTRQVASLEEVQKKTLVLTKMEGHMEDILGKVKIVLSGTEKHHEASTEHHIRITDKLENYDENFKSLILLASKSADGQIQQTAMLGYLKEIFNEMKSVVAENSRAFDRMAAALEKGV